MRSRSADIGRVLHALDDPTRRAIVDALSRRSVPASHLVAPLGITLTAIGQHLRVLEEARLVSTQKVGRTRTCHIERAGFELLDRWIHDHRAIWERRLDRLGAVLEDPDAK